MSRLVGRNIEDARERSAHLHGVRRELMLILATGEPSPLRVCALARCARWGGEPNVELENQWVCDMLEGGTGKRASSGLRAHYLESVDTLGLYFNRAHSTQNLG